MPSPNTPKEIVKVLEDVFKEATSNPEFLKQADSAAVTVDFRSTAELQKLISDEYEVLTKYKQFIK